MPKDKAGNQLTWKEYMARWKEGINGVTNLQRLKIQSKGVNIQLLGILLGIVMSIITIKAMWWVMIILIGAIIVTGSQKLGLMQQINKIEQIEKESIEMSLEEVFE